MTMKYPAAYLMCVLAGKEAPTAADIQKVLESVESEYDAEIAGKLDPVPFVAQVSELEGKTIFEIIKDRLLPEGHSCVQPRRQARAKRGSGKESNASGRSGLQRQDGKEKLKGFGGGGGGGVPAAGGGGGGGGGDEAAAVKEEKKVVEEEEEEDVDFDLFG
ncbi:unnamed protein product [Prorocentrum cordatum]|uniref:60S acidic ribosomal protein P2 n=1 Tax=Prorocentrum cordatum TaxID=2364126 RepID=A0ABN9UPZ1_9DINO|nr:unnamed protein product [Polarella glacialis]